jgi:hypothetical protein
MGLMPKTPVNSWQDLVDHEDQSSKPSSTLTHVHNCNIGANDAPRVNALNLEERLLDMFTLNLKA